jgi:hypothetical protein
MFDKFRNFITVDFPEILGCYEPQAATNGTSDPYCVIGLESESSDIGTEMTGIAIWNVFVYAKYYSDVIALAGRISRKINKDLDVSYEGTSGPPFKDTNLGLWQMQLNFSAPIILKEV